MVASASVSDSVSVEIQEKVVAQKVDSGNKKLVKLNNALLDGVNGASGLSAQAAVGKV